MKIAQYIIEELGISPFFKSYGGRSALMAAILGKRKKSLEVQQMICSREYRFTKDPNYLRRQMQDTDNWGNNPLHLAFRSNRSLSIDLMMKGGFGKYDDRNFMG